MDRRAFLGGIAALGGSAMSGRNTTEWADYHGIDLPTPGGSEDEWAFDLNTSIEDTLRQTPKVGPFAERPLASDVPDGALYRAVDRGVIYRAEGESWTITGEGDSTIGTPIDLVLVAGQSNARGKGVAEDSVIPDRAMAKQVAAGAISGLADPVGGPQYHADTGSAWPSFASSYVSLTGNRIAIAMAAVGSTAQTAAAGDADGNWSAQGSLRSDAVSVAQDALDTLESAGYNPTLRGIAWSQGEADAAAIDDGVITQIEYASAFEGMVSYFRSELRGDLPIWVFQTGRPRTADTAGFQAIRDAQLGFEDSVDHCRVVSTVQQQFPLDGLMGDGAVGELHYSQAGYNYMGRTGASNVVEDGGLVTAPDGQGGIVIDIGEVTLADPGNASDGSWDTSTTSSTTVQFDTAFASAPAVFVTDAERPGGVVQSAAGATSVDLTWRYYASSGSAAATVHWVAIGQPAR